jgi:divalent metal cation (Fe/Co/Zn/Cd) transporter
MKLSLLLGGVLLGAIVLKVWLSLFNRKLGRQIDSKVLIATAADSANDAIATGAVLLAAFVEGVTHWPVDGYVGLGVAVFIIRSGILQAKQTVSPLLGEAASPALRQEIVAVVTSDPRVLGYHDLMVHDYGPGQRFASIHVEMDQKEDPLLCHEIIDDLERACLEKHNVHLVIHYDPVVVGDAELEQVRCRVCAILAQIDSRLTVHDFRMVKGVGHSNLIFDISLPLDLRGQEMPIKHQLESALTQQGQGTYNTVITFDPGEF